MHCGLLSGYTLIAWLATLVWSGLVWRGVWSDGSRLEISITQANDK